MDHFRSFALPAETPRLQTWWNAVRDRDSIQAVANPIDYYVQRFAKVLGQPTPVGAAQK